MLHSAFSLTLAALTFDFPFPLHLDSQILSSNFEIAIILMISSVVGTEATKTQGTFVLNLVILEVSAKSSDLYL